MRSFSAQLTEIESLTPQVKRFRFRAMEGHPLSYSPGSSLRIRLPIGTGVWNAYSLTSDSWSDTDYSIAVRKEEAHRSKGGSIYLHEEARVGDRFEIQFPTNHFAPVRTARRHVLIAGGIGITPFISYLPSLFRWGHSFEVHYIFKEMEAAAFHQEIKSRLGAKFYGYESGKNDRIPLRDILSRQTVGTHVYVCGPEALIEAVRTVASELSWSPLRVHFEQFARSAEAPRYPFVAKLIRSNQEITVAETETLLEALERESITVPYSCRVGACGTCELRVIRGEVDHRDHCMSEEDRSGGRSLISCVSRAAAEELVLDL